MAKKSKFTVLSRLRILHHHFIPLRHIAVFNKYLSIAVRMMIFLRKNNRVGFFYLKTPSASSIILLGHPSARVTSQDGQYTLNMYLKKGGGYIRQIPCRPTDRPEAYRPIYYRFKTISLWVPFWSLTGAVEVNFGLFSLRSSLRVPFWRAYRKGRGRFLVIFVTDWSFTSKRVRAFFLL